MIHKFKFQIAFADTDAGGIVYHARHIEICERARMDMITGWDLTPGAGFIVRGLSAEYKKPMRLGEIVEVSTEFIEVGAASCKAQQTLSVGGEIRSVVTIDVVYVNKDLKPSRIPETLIEFMKGKK
ncbi:MAG: thioesterase family protein [Rickettsiales bacterium]|jgi:acyl-CoA thioester hydrolase|nr:thioesterase family protein [Rickettsiales bacterium]